MSCWIRTATSSTSARRASSKTACGSTFIPSVKTEKVARHGPRALQIFYYIITKSEIDALALENNLIKKYKPKYNILLKDDKTYPYVRVTVSERYPAFSIARKLQKGSKYFGPYMGGVRVKDVLELVNMAFGVRICGTAIGDKPKKNPASTTTSIAVAAPCAHLITEEEYGRRVQAAMRFLSGEEGDVEERLREKMNKYAESEEFELALDCRNKLEMLSKIALRRITALKRDLDTDVVAYTSNKLYAAVGILIIRGGDHAGGAHLCGGECL